jgi:succinate-semialdehyde dehydrogenase / glutarate-semialdehyde dehydrogenase
VQGAIDSKFRNNGQTCVCANRLYALAGIHDAFIARISAVVAKLNVGDGMEGGTVLGPFINEQAKAKFEDHISDAVSKGAKVVTGSPHALGGTYVMPTLIEGDTAEMKVAREGTFARLASVCKFQIADDVIAMANNTEFGLGPISLPSVSNRSALAQWDKRFLSESIASYLPRHCHDTCR